MPPTILAILLLALALWALYTAPTPTVSVVIGAGIVTHPHATAWTVATFAGVVIAAALTVTWRQLRASGWRLVMVSTPQTR